MRLGRIACWSQSARIDNEVARSSLEENVVMGHDGSVQWIVERHARFHMVRWFRQMTDPPEKPTNSSNFWVFCFLECPRLDFDADREYIKHATILITASYGSGLRNGTFSVIELVDIKTIGKGDVLGC